MTSLPPGESAPGFLRAGPKRPQSNGAAPDWQAAAAEFVHPEDPGAGEPEIDDGLSNRDANDVYLEEGSPAIRAALGAAKKPADGLPTLDLAALSQQPAQPKEFVVARLAPVGEVTLFTGPGSAGKSLLAQQMATCAAAGLHCLGLEVQPGPAIYDTCEEDAGQLHWRQEHICRAVGVGMASLAGKLHLRSSRGELDNELTIEPAYTVDGHTFPEQPGPAYRRLAAMIRSTGARLVFLDNVAHLYPGNENDRREVTRFCNLLNRLAGETGAAIVLIGHPNKGGDSYSGSTAWLNAVRSQFTLDSDRDADGVVLDPDARVLSVGKANYAQMGEALRFRWHEWAYILEDDLPADTRAELEAAIKANGENAAFLACLRERTTQGDGREVGPSPGPNYAPTQFEGMAQAKGFKKAALKRAMDRLFAIGRIETATVRNTAKARNVTVIREVPEGTPNASPNASRTRFPNGPEHPPEPARTHTVGTTYPMGAADGAAAPSDAEREQ